jgi:putative intracellular protease/amidase
MSKRVLFILSEYGYWGEELIGPLEMLEQAGYTVDFATPTGKRAHALPPSMDPDYFDPPLGKSVTSHQVAAKVKALEASTRLDNPISIASLMRERPYYASNNFLRELEEFNNTRDAAVKALIEKYAAIVIVGGSGPIVDLANNERLHEIILGFYRADKPIGAECYGVTCLAFARDWDDRKSIISGKHVTGHCKEYDYKDGTGFLNTDLNMGPPPYPLEYILRDATAPGGAYHGNFGRELSVIVDYPFVTGRSTHDSYLTGEKMVEVLEKGLRRFGW